MTHWTESHTNGIAGGIAGLMVAGLAAARPKAPVVVRGPSAAPAVARALGALQAENAALRAELERTRAHARRLEQRLIQLART